MSLPAIFAVTHKGEPPGSELNTDLMGPSGHQPDGHQRTSSVGTQPLDTTYGLFP
jgi:hypothetical protein